MPRVDGSVNLGAVPWLGATPATPATASASPAVLRGLVRGTSSSPSCSRSCSRYRARRENPSFVALGSWLY